MPDLLFALVLSVVFLISVALYTAANWYVRKLFQ